MKKKVPSVAELRKQGYKVKVIHERKLIHHSAIAGEKVEVCPTGGRTIVHVTPPIHDDMIISGVAECSKNDAYNRKLGVKIALGRALKKYQHEMF